MFSFKVDPEQPAFCYDQTGQRVNMQVDILEEEKEEKKKKLEQRVEKIQKNFWTINGEMDILNQVCKYEIKRSQNEDQETCQIKQIIHHPSQKEILHKLKVSVHFKKKGLQQSLLYLDQNVEELQKQIKINRINYQDIEKLNEYKSLINLNYEQKVDEIGFINLLQNEPDFKRFLEQAKEQTNQQEQYQKNAQKKPAQQKRELARIEEMSIVNIVKSPEGILIHQNQKIKQPYKIIIQSQLNLQNEMEIEQDEYDFEKYLQVKNIHQSLKDEIVINQVRKEIIDQNNTFFRVIDDSENQIILKFIYKIPDLDMCVTFVTSNSQEFAYRMDQQSLKYTNILHNAFKTAKEGKILEKFYKDITNFKLIQCVQQVNLQFSANIRQIRPSCRFLNKLPCFTKWYLTINSKIEQKVNNKDRGF